MDCAVVLFRHGAPLLCEIAICQAASSVFLAPTASFSPIGQMLLVFGGRLLQEFGLAFGKLVFSAAQERDHTDALPAHDQRHGAIRMKTLSQSALLGEELVFCFHIAADYPRAMLERPAIVALFPSEQYPHPKIAVREFALPRDELQSILFRFVES